MKYLFEEWKTDKWKTILNALWLFTIITSFWHDDFLGVNIPGLGQIFPFRVMLPLTLVLFLFWTVHNRIDLWKMFEPMEKILILLIGILVIHSGISLSFAIDFSFSFRRFFNLLYDLGFLFLTMCLCRDKNVFQQTIWICLINVCILCLLGVWECFFGPIIISSEYIQYEKLYGWQISSPMVNINNTNSFMSSIMFLVAVCILWWMPRKLKSKQFVGLCGIAVVIYFLLECASARLLLIAFWIMVIGVAVYAVLLHGKKAMAIFAVLIILLGFSCTKKINVKKIVESTTTSQEIIQNQNTKPLEDEPNKVNQQTKEKKITQLDSIRIRWNLLLHTVDCFVESKGMGVGIGNTEQLAKNRAIALDWEIWSIHCFLARLLGDYGIWALLPICGYVYMLLKYIITSFLQSIKKKDYESVGYYLLFLLTAATFVLISTSPSEAQDILPMWLFLGAIPLLIRFDEKGVEKNFYS